MKRIFSLISLLIFITNSGSSQITKFEKIFGGTGYDYGYSVVQTYDKGYAVAGSTTSFGSGNSDVYILKTDSIGVLQWQKTFGGINIDQGFSIKETMDSGLVIAGYTNSFGYGGYDMYVIKTNKFGDTIWTRTYGGSNWDFAYSIQQTADSGYIITGGTYSFGNGNEDIFLVKIDMNGDTIWTKTFGGINEDFAKSVIQTTDDGYILAGQTKSYNDPNGDFYIIKTNNSGDTLWTKKYGDTLEDYATDIIESNTGEYIISGNTKSYGNGDFDGLIIRLSSTGILTYNNTYGGVDNDGINSIVQSSDTRFAMIGYTYTYGHALGTDDYVLYIENPFSGFHSATFGGDRMETGNCIKNTYDNGYIICGNSSSYTTFDHIYLIKTDSDGVASGTINIITTDINIIRDDKSQIILYPNPSSNILCVKLLDIKNKHNLVTITDILGKEIYKTNIDNLNIPAEINTSALKNGVYIISIKNNDFSHSERFIIQH